MRAACVPSMKLGVEQAPQTCVGEDFSDFHMELSPQEAAVAEPPA